MVLFVTRFCTAELTGCLQNFELEIELLTLLTGYNNNTFM